MKFRRPATLVATFEDGQIILHNFLTRDRFVCSAEYLEFLAKLDDWHGAEDLFSYFPDTDRASLARQFVKLVAAKALIVKGSPDAVQDEKYRREWLWGVPAGFFHFSVRGTQFITGKPARTYMRKLRASGASPKLVDSNVGRHITRLPATDTSRGLFALMRKRRSQRQFDEKPISMQALADCLFAGNGVVEFRQHADSGRLPVAMTPSGGGRNPFELYVYARNVSGLKAGFYHYDAVQQDLGLVRAGKADVSKMLGTQRWPAKAAAVIFLVAHFPRTMWKYRMPIAYRVVMMEAGFIGQNVSLAATHHGLSAVPSGALDERLIEDHLGTPAMESAVVLSLSVGRPKAQLG
jgi:SagB-type dehydrogenase family enzyme